ncbi:MAG: bifunctional ornithine acetyltransferase/N-acetylglutamate synthase, partial [Myxococcales bacterium]|nr:bifunctional ornithine acetyltransferase/N-acetylglutamate synthase [Polyangiaceae bacterium]MDW8251475.1 bifunctional ornithine acetyltransferase/N-acetylglutamate synthase [Myxococcales bacterium]
LGTEREEDARRLARAVVASNLVKAAIFGAEPNWGRVVAALGAEAARSEIPLDIGRMSLKIQDMLLFKGGRPVPFEADALRSLLRRSDALIRIELGGGPGKATAWGCDLSYDYVRINADYAAVVVEDRGGLV